MNADEGYTHLFFVIEHFAAEDVASRVENLNKNMESLCARAARRQNDLEANVQFQQYMANLQDADAWISEKEPIADSTNYGADEEAAGVRWGSKGTLSNECSPRDLKALISSLLSCDATEGSVRLFRVPRMINFDLCLLEYL